MLIVMILDKEA